MINQPHTVAVDFDGTIYAGPWTHADEIIGKPNHGAIEWLISEVNRGHRLIIHTCRLTASYKGCPFPESNHRDTAVVVACIRQWLLSQGMSSLEVESLEFWTRPGKPWAHEYLDDRAVRFEGTFPQRG